MQYKGFVKGIELNVLIGIYAKERQGPQPLIMDIEYIIDNNIVANTDDIADTLNYQTLVDHLREVAQASQYQLVETLAQKLLIEVEKNFEVSWVKIRLAKTSAIDCAQYCGVEVEQYYART